MRVHPLPLALIAATMAAPMVEARPGPPEAPRSSGDHATSKRDDSAAKRLGLSPPGRSDRQANAKTRKPKPDAAARAAIAQQDPLTQMTFWAEEQMKFPTDAEATRSFAEALRTAGRHDRAIEVAARGLTRFDHDLSLYRTLGLSLIATGRGAEAVVPMAHVAARDPKSWQARSALGIALDMAGRFADARKAYAEALAMAPDDPGVLTNLGMSHLLAGEPKEAENVLAKAAGLPGASLETRQNLALAIGLQGRFEEAEAKLRADLPPEMAEENVAYLRGLLREGRRWGDARARGT